MAESFCKLFGLLLAAGRFLKGLRMLDMANEIEGDSMMAKYSKGNLQVKQLDRKRG